MDVIPIISDGFNIYFPILIFFVCLATYFNVCSRVLHFIGFEQFIGDDEMTSDLIEEGRELIKRGLYLYLIKEKFLNALISLICVQHYFQS